MLAQSVKRIGDGVSAVSFLGDFGGIGCVVLMETLQTLVNDPMQRLFPNSVQ